MPSLTELSKAELRDAGDAIETLIEFRDYLPGSDGVLLVVATRWAEDIREALGLPPLWYVEAGARKPLEDLGLKDLKRLDKAAELILSRFARKVNDSELFTQVIAFTGVISHVLIAAADRARTEAAAKKVQAS